jgi:hypothetical protein
MIPYHGTPCGATREDVARFLKNRHALISFYRPEDIGTAAEVCQSFCVDNGAFSAWKNKETICWEGYYDFVRTWYRHPAFDFAFIPDVIDGTECDNNELVHQWPLELRFIGVAVWHMHESIDRLRWLCEKFERVALGSSGDYATVGTQKWWNRMSEAMRGCCDDLGRPLAKLHGLRMLDPDVFTRLPLASADSTNAVRNSSSFTRFGIYCPPNASTRMSIIAERVEAFQSASVWDVEEDQKQFEFEVQDEA